MDGLYPGKVFNLSFRNVNLKARSTKDGMVYKFEAEITEDDWDEFRGVDLTGSVFEAPELECVEVGQPKGGKPVASPVAKPEPEKKPYGMEASELYRSGFFYNFKVLNAIGGDDAFLAWLVTQPCCAVEIEPREPPFHHGDIVAAHVRRIANGAGTGIKPMYSAVPMCDRHHKMQHQHGESAVGGAEYFDEQRNKHLVRWASRTLAKLFEKESMGYVSPDTLREWAMREELLNYLPQSYRR